MHVVPCESIQKGTRRRHTGCVMPEWAESDADCHWTGDMQLIQKKQSEDWFQYHWVKNLDRVLLRFPDTKK